MPPIVLLAVVGAGCYAGYKLFTKLIEQAGTPSREDQERARAARAAAKGSSVTRDLGELEFDDTTGVYRPKNKG